MYWVMGKPMLLLGKMQHAENLLQKRMTIYSDRPSMVMAQDLVTRDGWYLGTAQRKHGTHSKQRKILAQHLKKSELPHWAHPVQIPEVHLLLQRLTQYPEQYASIVKCFTVNVMLNSTFAHGSVPRLDDPLITRINRASDHQFVSQVMGRFWVDYFPPLKYLPSFLPGMGWKRTGLRWREEVDTLYSELWDATAKQAEKGATNPSLVKNLIDHQMHKITYLEGTTIGAAVVDAGTETLTGTTIILYVASERMRVAHCHWPQLTSFSI